jgi:hypothetical protein
MTSASKHSISSSRNYRLPPYVLPSPSPRTRANLRFFEQFSDPDALAAALRQSLKSNNSHVASAALAVLPSFFRSLASSSDPLHLKHAFSLLLPFDKLGDAKIATRTLAREAVVSAAQASLSLGINAGVGGREKEGPWQVLEKGMHDFGFKSKNAKAREQVRYPISSFASPS